MVVELLEWVELAADKVAGQGWVDLAAGKEVGLVSNAGRARDSKDLRSTRYLPTYGQRWDDGGTADSAL